MVNQSKQIVDQSEKNVIWVGNEVFYIPIMVTLWDSHCHFFSQKFRPKKERQNLRFLVFTNWYNRRHQL
jgi:hypothetical protein